MDVFITDKNEVWELSYIKNGVDIARDVIGDDMEGAGFRYNADDERWECDSDNYEWWDDVFSDLQSADELEDELRDKGIDLADRLFKELIGINDIDKWAAAKRAALEQIAKEYDRPKDEYKILVDGKEAGTVEAWDADQAIQRWHDSQDGYRFFEFYNGKGFISAVKV